MAIEADVRSTSRRAMLVGLVGGLAAGVAGALGRVSPALATHTGYIDAGVTNDTTAMTRVAMTGSDLYAFVVESAQRGVYGVGGSGYGVRGDSDSSWGVLGLSGGSVGVMGWAWVPGENTGVMGYSGPLDTGLPPAGPAKTGVYGYAVQDATARGVLGESTLGRGVEGKATTGNGVWGESDAAAVVGKSNGSSTGVFGFSGSASDALPGAASKTGVFGFARQDSSSIGVYGNSSFGRGVLGEAGAGRGVHGWSNTGVGVRAEAAAGTALQVAGRASFSRSGRLAIAAGRSFVTKTGITPLTSFSLVLAVLQTRRTGVYIVAAVPNVTGHSFTIYLNKAVPATTYVAWFILN
jgi:hypothetical protein